LWGHFRNLKCQAPNHKQCRTPNTEQRKKGTPGRDARGFIGFLSRLVLFEIVWDLVLGIWDLPADWLDAPRTGDLLIDLRAALVLDAAGPGDADLQALGGPHAGV